MYSHKRAQQACVSLTIYISVLMPGVQAEVVLDGTLGPSGALSGPDYAITESLGQTRGNNLFHSFSDFNLSSGESATFSGPSNITNVISRVTGGNPSSIDGAINSTIDGANLYLINPSGVMFGENASLNVSGSFYATTADYVTLGSDGRFDASHPANSVLTMSAPSAFGFVDGNIAPISVTRSRFTLPQGVTLALIGGDITLTGQNAVVAGSDIDVPSGQVQLIALASAGELDVSGAGPDVSGFQQLGNIRLNDYFGISTSGDPGGTILIRGGELIIDGGILSSATMGTTDHPGNGIDIAVTDDVVVRTPDAIVDDSTEIASSSYGSGHAGDIVIRAGRVLLDGDVVMSEANPSGHYSAIASRAWAEGDSGDITINADDILLGVNSHIATDSFAAGNAGDLSLSADTINLAGTAGAGTRISSIAYSAGDAGNLDLTANDIYLLGGAAGLVGITSQVASTSNSNAISGDITISTRNLNIQDGAQVSADIFSGSGHAGDVSVTAYDIHIAGLNAEGYNAGIFSTTSGWYTSGDGGNIEVNAGSLTLENGGRVNSSALSFGGAGDIAVNADSVRIIGAVVPDTSTGLFAVSGWVASHGGNINVTAGNIELIDGGVINSQTVGWGPSGNVTVNAGRLLITGIDEINSVPSQILATTAVYFYPDYALGNGGNITITADAVEVSDSARITTASSSSGNGGDTTINAGTIRVSGNGTITATSTNSGTAGNLNLSVSDSLTIDNSEITTSAAQSDGGDITIRAQQLVYLNNGAITTSVQGADGNGGNIDIDPVFVVLNHSSISADAQGGDGGNITLVADNYLASPDSSLSASSNLGVAGAIVVNAPNKDVSTELEAVPEPAPDASQYFRNDCVAVGGGFSSFVAAQRGPAMAGSKVFMPSSYTTNSAQITAKEKRADENTPPDKPVLILAKHGVDCLSRL